MPQLLVDKVTSAAKPDLLKSLINVFATAQEVELSPSFDSLIPIRGG